MFIFMKKRGIAMMQQLLLLAKKMLLGGGKKVFAFWPLQPRFMLSSSPASAIITLFNLLLHRGQQSRPFVVPLR
jgi:hypothetical protein